MIPEAAVEAALKEWGVGGEVPRNIIKLVLEAAGPHMNRTIHSATERAELLPGTIGVDLEGNAWKRGTGSWVSTGGDTPALYDDMHLTLTVLLEGDSK